METNILTLGYGRVIQGQSYN